MSTLPPDPDPIIESDLSLEDAERLVKASPRGQTIFLSCTQFAPFTKEQALRLGNGARGRYVSGNLIVTKKVALKYFRDAYRYREGLSSEVLVRMAQCRLCLFIGAPI